MRRAAPATREVCCRVRGGDRRWTRPDGRARGVVKEHRGEVEEEVWCHAGPPGRSTAGQAKATDAIELHLAAQASRG